jgi:hypothetical protein
MSILSTTPVPGQSLGGIPAALIELEDGRVLDPSESQLDHETGSVALADELSTALAAPDEPRFQQDADAFPDGDDPSEDELCDLYAATVQQREDDPAAEPARIGAMIAGAIPGSLTTFTRMTHYTFDARGRETRATEMWAVLVTAGGAMWHGYATAASIRLAAARVLEAWAFRPE